MGLSPPFLATPMGLVFGRQRSIVGDLSISDRMDFIPCRHRGFQICTAPIHQYPPSPGYRRIIRENIVVPQKCSGEEHRRSRGRVALGPRTLDVCSPGDTRHVMLSKVLLKNEHSSGSHLSMVCIVCLCCRLPACVFFCLKAASHRHSHRFPSLRKARSPLVLGSEGGRDR